MSEEVTGNLDSGVAPEAAPAVESVTTEGSFLGSISEDLRGEASLSDFKDVSALAKSYVNSQRMLGSSIRIPTEDTGADQRTEFYSKLQSIPGVINIPTTAEDTEGWANFYTKLGRPETAEGYTVKAPEGMEVSPEMLNMAHAMGLNSNQVNQYIEHEANQLQAQEESTAQARATTEAALHQVWGNDYNNRMDGAKAAIASYQSKNPEAVAELINGPAGNNPVFLQMLSDMHGGLQERGLASTSATSVQYGTSAEEALDKINEIRANPKHPVNNQYDPGHDAAIKKLQSYYENAFPGK